MTKIKKRKRVCMKVSRISKGLLLGAAMLMATDALAANKGSLKIYEPVTVNGTKLAVGDYQVKWEGTGPNVELNIIKSNRVIATVPVRLVELSRPERDSASVTRKVEDGTTSLTEIRFSGKKYELSIGQEAASVESGSDGNQK
jgi:hypothetical protein